MTSTNMTIGSQVLIPFLGKRGIVAMIDGNNVWVTYRWHLVTRTELCNISQLMVVS